VEGNYLLLDDGPWARVADYLDESWYVVVDDDLRRERLVARHERFGRTRAEALAWVEQTDEPNAMRIAQGRHRATRQVGWAD
jgi:pantothenate kinase